MEKQIIENNRQTFEIFGSQQIEVTKIIGGANEVQDECGGTETNNYGVDDCYPHDLIYHSGDWFDEGCCVD